MDVSRLSATDAATATAELQDVYSSGPINEIGLRNALRNPDFVLLVARKEDAAAGYLHGALIDRVDGGQMLLVYDIEVADSHRRQGVGTALVSAARHIARESGASETWLVTESDNEEAMALYEKLGGKRFAAVGYEWREG